MGINLEKQLMRIMMMEAWNLAAKMKKVGYMGDYYWFIP